MKIEYDPEADAMYITVKEGEVSYNVVVDENTILDFNKKGELLGIEILFVKERNPSFLKELKEKKLIIA